MNRDLRPNLKCARRIVGEETLVVTPHDGVLHTLNPSATEFLSRLEAGLPWTRIVDELEGLYEVERVRLEADLQELAEALLAKGIVEAGAPA